MQSLTRKICLEATCTYKLCIFFLDRTKMSYSSARASWGTSLTGVDWGTADSTKIDIHIQPFYWHYKKAEKVVVVSVRAPKVR
jgi:hypothetical protein